MRDILTWAGIGYLVCCAFSAGFLTCAIWTAFKRERRLQEGIERLRQDFADDAEAEQLAYRSAQRIAERHGLLMDQPLRDDVRQRRELETWNPPLWVASE